MKRFAVLGGLLSIAVLQAQVEQLATSGDGHVLLFHSHFRLQTETDLGPQGKIYRWQDGEWTRLAAAPEAFILTPPDVFGPFLSTDGAVAGWQTYVGCGLCQIIIAPPLGSQVSGVDLPTTFPRGTLRMSANGRFFTADNYPFSGAKYLDAATGQVSDVPVDLFTRPVMREVANDGTTLLLITPPTQGGGPGVLALWKPGDPRPIYPQTRIFNATISANGGRVAFEADEGQRTLMVVDTGTGERFSVASTLANSDPFAHPVWDESGTKLVYRAFDDQGQPFAISLWDAGTRQSSVLLTSDEGFADAVISGNGQIVWAVTNTNRLLRLNLSTGATDEILPPLGTFTFGPDGAAVPGSALLIRGAGFTTMDTVFDGPVQLPLVDAGPDGLWIQIPWEDRASPGVHKILIRSGNNPFEAVINMGVTTRVEPHIATWVDPTTGRDYAKAVHSDFQTLVTPASPAKAGETVHVYLTGLGPLDQAVATGAAGPATPPAHPLTPLNCRLGNEPLQMPYLVYAPGLIGVYQADLTIPTTRWTAQRPCFA